jgi:uncharacterized protein (TIGR00251 family)
MEDVQKLLDRKCVSIRVFPNARKTAIKKIEAEILYIDVAAPPEEGKANNEVERYLSKLTGKKAKVKIGKTSKNKTVEFS